MTQVLVPDGLPSLARGAHGAGEGLACVMEMVSVLAGEEWSDHPACVHPYLADSAILVNDTLPDHYRHLLVPHIGRFFGTNEREATKPLFTYFRGFLPPSIKTRYMGTDVVVHEAFTAFTEGADACPCCAGNMSARRATHLVSWLDRALSVAERALGVTQPRPITADDVVFARRVVGVG